MIGPRRTYEDVAAEIADGLAEGTIRLDHDRSWDELRSLTDSLLQFVSGYHIHQRLPSTSGAKPSLSASDMVIELVRSEADHLDRDKKDEFEALMGRLRQLGVGILLVDPPGVGHTAGVEAGGAAVDAPSPSPM